MVPTQVQRTLVKSPPELWAELSDPAALAKHLGELGDIRITRIVPEHEVEWTADAASGTVLLKPSGWGTRVTLTASRRLEQPEPSPRADEAKADPHTDTSRPPQAPAPASPVGAAPPATLAAATETVAPTRSPQPPLARTHATSPSATREPVAPAIAPFEPQPAEVVAAGQGWRRLFAGVRRRVRRDDTALRTDEQPPASAPLVNAEAEASGQPAERVPEAPAEEPAETPPAPASLEPAAPVSRAPTAFASEPPPAAAPFSPPAVTPEPPAVQGPEHGSDDVEALLSAVLDALGSAHHRPFSRS